jgi:hypothetical protein
MKIAACLFAFMSIIPLLVGGCGQKPTGQSAIAPDAPKIKLAVFNDGRITADGSPVTIESLREMFKTLAAKKGVVWYYREDAKGAPPPQATEVIKEVIAARLPISFSSLPDYSNVVLPDGKSHPRQ